jgi:hypothetical protein
MRWRRRFEAPTEPTFYPTGVCVRTESGYYYIKGNFKYRIPTKRVLKSWNFSIIVDSSDAAIKHYRLIGKLGFRDGTIVRDFTTMGYYVVSESKFRKIDNPDCLTLWNVKPKDIVNISHYEVELHRKGDPIK